MDKTKSIIAVLIALVVVVFAFFYRLPSEEAAAPVDEGIYPGEAVPPINDGAATPENLGDESQPQ